MIVTIEPKAKPCPGVERAIALVEDNLRRGEKIFSVGNLIHNRREVERLEKLGLQMLTNEELHQCTAKKMPSEAGFLVRCHGETNVTLDKAKSCGLYILDATCPIVKHSQEVVDQHVRDGWGIIIAAGRTDHPEVVGLLDRTGGNGMVVTSKEDAEKMDFEDRSLLLAQTTVNPGLFSDIRRILSKRLNGLKIVDTTCRFIKNRQKDIESFSAEQDMIVMVGGKDSANCHLLFDVSKRLNKNSYWIEGTNALDKSWFNGAEKIGITGGASTPRWQLEEIRSYISNNHSKKNPKGKKNRKGGKFLWWMWKNLSTEK